MKTRSEQKKEEGMGQAVSDEPAQATLNAGEVQELIFP